jgi:hypothetical protein
MLVGELCIDVFSVEKTSGDITSMLYNGIQAQDQTKRSHIVSQANELRLSL